MRQLVLVMALAACSTKVSEEPAPAPAAVPRVEPKAVEQPPIPKPSQREELGLTNLPKRAVFVQTLYMADHHNATVDLDARTLTLDETAMSYEPLKLTVKLTDDEVAQLEKLVAAHWDLGPAPKSSAMDVFETIAVADGDRAQKRAAATINDDALFGAVQHIASRYPMKEMPH